MTTILVTGAGGRIGGVLRRLWPDRLPKGLRAVWQSRGDLPGGGAQWRDDLTAPDRAVPGLAGGVVLGLAGVTRAPAEEQGRNVDLALASCRLAAASGARHVFVASSASVVGAGGAADFADTAAPVPANAYGQAKAQMEQAVQDWHAAQPKGAPGVTILRIGNIAGLDALLGNSKPGVSVALDPVVGQVGGPVRSYIGPITLAGVLADLCDLAARGADLPLHMNICADPPVAMADLLAAAGVAWHQGPENPAVVARVVLDNRRLCGLVTLPPDAGDPARMVQEWRILTEHPA